MWSPGSFYSASSRAIEPAEYLLSEPIQIASYEVEQLQMGGNLIVLQPHRRLYVRRMLRT
jgi:hypothetical protein